MDLRMFTFRRARRLSSDKRGIAAVEFALIAPTLIVMFMGVLEVTFRFQASEETTRYVHQVADLISREHSMTTADLDAIYDASVYMMRPLETTNNLDLDVLAVAYRKDASDVIQPEILWRRTAGTSVPFVPGDVTGLGSEDESVIWVGVRYHYHSPITSMFGGPDVNIERVAFARPRALRLIKMDGAEDHNGASQTFGT